MTCGKLVEYRVDRIKQLLYSLCNREAFPKDYAAPPFVSQSPALDFVLDLAFKLPPLLASADMITPTAVSEVSTHDKVVRDLAALEKALKSWLGSFRMSAKPPNFQDVSLSFRKSPTQALPDMASESLCRICLLLIYQALSSLHKSRKSSGLSQDHAEELAAACAEDLYRHTLLLSQVAERPVSKAM